MEDVVAEVIAMGHDPHSKKNSTTVDYIDTLHHDISDFIRPEQFDLGGRAVFITGASRGLGKEFAISYAYAGASKIGIGARSKLEDVTEVVKVPAKAAGRTPPDVLAVNMVVTKASSVSNAAAEVGKAFGGLDILINNARHRVYTNGH
jgi:NAD(P)-dependent dehydrogenase (short-subunit alcohol dehydrogenase family)